MYRDKKTKQISKRDVKGTRPDKPSKPTYRKDRIRIKRTYDLSPAVIAEIKKIALDQGVPASQLVERFLAFSIYEWRKGHIRLKKCPLDNPKRFSYRLILPNARPTDNLDAEDIKP